MDIASRSALLPLSALVVVPVVCLLLAPSRVAAADIPSSVPAAAAPAERSSSQTWADDLERRLLTYLTKKYPSYDFSPYTQELDRIRDAVNRGNRWAVKREMGVFLKMLANRAYGLEDDAADDLTDLAQQTMPAEEFAIVYPGSMAEVRTLWIRA